MVSKLKYRTLDHTLVISSGLENQEPRTKPPKDLFKLYNWNASTTYSKLFQLLKATDEELSAQNFWVRYSKFKREQERGRWREH